MAVSLVAAMIGAVAYTCASLLQAVGVRRTSAAGHRVMRAVRQWPYLLGLLCDFAGWLLSLVALRELPLFSVQAILAASLALTVLVDGVLLHARLRRADRWAIVVTVAAIALLGAAAGPQRAHAIGIPVDIALFSGVVLTALAGFAAVRSGHPTLAAAVSGVAFGGGAVAARALSAESGLIGFATHPLALTLVAFGAIGLLTYAHALEGGHVGPATAVMWVSDIVAAGLVGILLLGDMPRPGWWVPTVLATGAAVAAIVVLGRSPAQPSLDEPEPDITPPPIAVAAAVAVRAGDPGPQPARRGSRKWWPVTRRVLEVLLGFGAGAAALYAVGGRRSELAGAAAALEHLRWPWLALAAAAELASIVAYAALQRRMLASGGVVVGMPALTGIALAAYAIQNSLPAGPAWSAVFAFRQFRKRGADTVVAGWTMVVVPVLSGACLAGLAVVGTLLAAGRASSLGLVGVIAGAGLLATALIVAERRFVTTPTAGSFAVRLIRASQRVFRRPKGDAAGMVDLARRRLVAVSPRRRDWGVATTFGVANWSLDCACLVLAFIALGAAVPWRGLLLTYGAGQLAANLPITPGGLGVVEGSLTVGLVFYGGAQVSTVAAVLLYRILSFWAMLPLGWGSWLVLRMQRDTQAEVVSS